MDNQCPHPAAWINYESWTWVLCQLYVWLNYCIFEFVKVKVCLHIFKSILQFIPKHVDLPKAGLFIDPPPKWRFPVIFRDLLNLLSVKLSKVNNNKLKLFRSVQIKGQIWVRVGKFESNRNYMGRLKFNRWIPRLQLGITFYLNDFFYNRNFQKIKIDSVISDIISDRISDWNNWYIFLLHII